MLKRDFLFYFFGIIYVFYIRVWNFILENIKVVFEELEDIVFELDLINLYIIFVLVNCQFFSSGKILDSIFLEDIYVRFKDYIQYVKFMLLLWMIADQKGMGLYVDYLFDIIVGNWERKRLIWVMLMVNFLIENDIKFRGILVLDFYLVQEVEKMGKVIGVVERVEEQCVLFNEFDFFQVCMFLMNYVLFYCLEILCKYYGKLLK